MQDAMDSFYVTLRDRIAAISPGRTIAVRGVVRPAVLVAENELPTAFMAADAFWLRWTDLAVDTQGAMPLAKMRCEIRYWTAGMIGNGSMDRGRLLVKMDREISMALRAEPQSATKMSYASSPATALGTNVFWTDVVFEPAVADGERVSRKATVEVFSYEEAGDR